MWGCHCSDSGRYCNKGVPSLARELPLVAGIAKKHIYIYICMYVYIYIYTYSKSNKIKSIFKESYYDSSIYFYITRTVKKLKVKDFQIYYRKKLFILIANWGRRNPNYTSSFSFGQNNFVFFFFSF